MPCSRLLQLATLFLSLLLDLAWAQRTGQAPTLATGTSAEQTQQDKVTQRNLAIQRQKERFEDVKRDSQKLLELATELKQYVDKSGKDVPLSTLCGRQKKWKSWRGKSRTICEASRIAVLPRTSSYIVSCSK